jgi:uncharacterized membrane protein YuzA (DUF378 family)
MIIGGVTSIVTGLAGVLIPDPVTTVIGTKAIITGVAEIIGGICAAFLGIGDIIGESE